MICGERCEVDLVTSEHISEGEDESMVNDLLYSSHSTERYAYV